MTRRLVIASIVAPPLGTLTWLLLANVWRVLSASLHGVSKQDTVALLIMSLLSYLGLMIGLPVYFLLRKRLSLRFWHFLIIGAVSGLITFVLFVSFLSLPDPNALASVWREMQLFWRTTTLWGGCIGTWFWLLQRAPNVQA